ncbi:MAG: hypothetical protein GX195_10295 [Firmicutes bacterium]|jgi:hypothetical protein|nr:hypothetical protein [Bacillota bacterium]
MRKGIYTVTLVLAALVMSTAADAASVGGELQASVVYELEAGISSAPLHLTVAVSDDLSGKGKLHAALKGRLDPVEDVYSAALGEVYGSFYLGDVDLTVGRKIISWGTVDAFGPTNYFARLSEDALVQGSMAGEPVTGVQAAYYGPGWTITGVVLPVFKPQAVTPLMREKILAEPNGELLLAAIEETAPPPFGLENMELGVRVETSAQGWDVQLSAYRGFEPLPGVRAVTTLIPFTTTLEGEYRRQTYVGAAVVGFVGDVGIRAEVAYGGPTPFPEARSWTIVTPLSQNKSAWKGAVGVEYLFPIGNGLLAQGQYIYEGRGSLFSPYFDPTVEPEPAHYLMGRISYNFTLENRVELTALYSRQDGSALLLPSFTYRLTQGLELRGSCLKNVGDGELTLLPDQVRAVAVLRF